MIFFSALVERMAWSSTAMSCNTIADVAKASEHLLFFAFSRCEAILSLETDPAKMFVHSAAT